MGPLIANANAGEEELGSRHCLPQSGMCFNSRPADDVTHCCHSPFPLLPLKQKNHRGGPKTAMYFLLPSLPEVVMRAPCFPVSLLSIFSFTPLHFPLLLSIFSFTPLHFPLLKCTPYTGLTSRPCIFSIFPTFPAPSQEPSHG